MKIAIPVAHYHAGNTAEYVQRAFQKIGHNAEILNQTEFNSAFKSNQFDFYFCVDSGEALQLDGLRSEKNAFNKLAFWFIDFRHNKNRASRNPPDYYNAHLISEGGGYIFQAQAEDVEDCLVNGIKRVSWLPVAADPDIWKPSGENPEKHYDIGFAGNIWDQARLTALRSIKEAGFKLAFLGHGAVWKEKAAGLLSRSRMGFNISSFYGEPYAFDLNMRFFETLSCGVPLITNYVDSLNKVFVADKKFILCYHSLAEIPEIIKKGLQSQEFLSSGQEAREWIMNNGTYQHRMKEVLRVLNLG